MNTDPVSWAESAYLMIFFHFLQQPPAQRDMRTLMGQLSEMGFCDRQLNERLLKKYNLDVRKVIFEIVQENDNNWSEARH